MVIVVSLASRGRLVSIDPVIYAYSFTSHPLTSLHRAMLQDRGIANPEDIIFRCSKDERKNFYRTVARGINRPLFSIYRRIIRSVPVTARSVPVTTRQSRPVPPISPSVSHGQSRSVSWSVTVGPRSVTASPLVGPGQSRSVSRSVPRSVSASSVLHLPAYHQAVFR